MTKKVVIVEDHQLLAEAISAWVDQQMGFRVVGLANTGIEGLQVCHKEKPDLVLLDIELPEMDGLEMAKKLKDVFPDTVLLAISGRKDPYTIWRVIQSNINGYVDKSQPLDKLHEALQTVLEGHRYFSPLFLKVHTEWLMRPEAFQKILSTREQDIIKYVVQGHQDDAIATGMCITIGTVKTHRRNIRKKLGLHSDRDLMGYARRWGLFTNMASTSASDE